MHTINPLYQNTLGNAFELYNKENTSIIMLEIGSVSFMINHHKLSAFLKSLEQIITYHRACTCPKNLKNKMIIYQADNIEIRMKLSFDELFLLKDLLKGTKFNLEIDKILDNYRIK